MSTNNGRASILVVDDTPANLEILTQMLNEKGHRPRPVPSGAIALRAAEHEPPDLILMDINMPEMDGFETCRRIKAIEQLSDVPIIFISARTDTLDKINAFHAGGVDYITKPFDMEEVTARVETHLEIRRLQQELQEQNIALENSNANLREMEQLRDNLVHMVVHDMRSPLTVIQMALRFLRDGAGKQLDEESQQDIADAATSSETLVKMVNDLLDVSRFESNQMPLNLQENDLTSTLKQAIDQFGLHATEGRIYMQGEFENVRLNFDRELISRVITNLVGNALKFSPSGADIRITIKKSADKVEVSVHDDGPGIPKEYHIKIFEKFGQATNKRDKIPSTGLGLTFCKLALEAHHGEIGVDSEPGKGSRFWFLLPLTPVEVDGETEINDDR